MGPMWSLVPGEDGSTGNVMGGRKLARYVLEAVVGRCHKYSGPPSVKFTLRIRTWRGRNRRSDKSAGQDEKASAETSRLAP